MFCYIVECLVIERSELLIYKSMGFLDIVLSEEVRYEYVLDDYIYVTCLKK